MSRGTSTDVMQQLSLAGGRSDGDDNTKLDSNSKLSSTDKVNWQLMSHLIYLIR